MQTINEKGFNVPVKTWLPVDEIESGAMEQLHNAARHPEVATSAHVAVMPDCHVGFGVTIGCVYPTAGSVVPNAVGVDIGCGMCAINTGVVLDTDTMDARFWRRWAAQVARDVPTGFSWHKRRQDLGDLDRQLRATALQSLIREKASVQLGTLGGGNHFMEAQVDETGVIWLMVHSGSRHTGLRIANHYNQIAEDVTKRRGLAVGKGLATLPLDDWTGQDYLHDMHWAEDFALESRRAMIMAMWDAFEGGVGRMDVELRPVTGGESFINIHHNFAALENHQGTEVMVHRKGATQAMNGQLGIIPGSMGSNSYIVRGKGNAESLASCSHGAGRRMGRKAAKRDLTIEQFRDSLADTHSVAGASFLDEAPAAYKDIDTVIERQLDLIDVVHTLHPIITVKGDSRAKED